MGPKRVMWVRRYQGQCRALPSRLQASQLQQRSTTMQRLHEGAAGDGPGDVGDGDGERAMVMLPLPMEGGCCMGRNGWWPWAMHR